MISDVGVREPMPSCLYVYVENVPMTLATHGLTNTKSGRIRHWFCRNSQLGQDLMATVAER